METTSAPLVVGNIATPPVQDIPRVQEAQAVGRDAPRVAEAQAAGQPVVRMIVEAQAVDVRSSQFQCAVRVENPGSQPLQIVSIRPLAPLGTVVQQVTDTSQSEARVARDHLYRDLSVLLSGYLVNTSANYRQTIVENLLTTFRNAYSAKGVAKLYYAILSRQVQSVMRNMTETVHAWMIEIRNSTRAQSYYDEFLKDHEVEAAALCSIYKAKLEDVRQLETELGNAGQDLSVADVLPGGTFSRTYIYNCERRLLNPKTYTFSFDCGYIDHAGPRQKHLAGSITGVISPKPLVLNLFAVISAILGAVLKIALDTQAKAATTSTTAIGVPAPSQPTNLFSQLSALVTVTACEAIIAAM